VASNWPPPAGHDHSGDAVAEEVGKVRISDRKRSTPRRSVIPTTGMVPTAARVEVPSRLKE